MKVFYQSFLSGGDGKCEGVYIADEVKIDGFFPICGSRTLRFLYSVIYTQFSKTFIILLCTF